ncbi:protein FAM169B isoform X3 [Etheostoma cragini]|uniref:protein FAM169B isoform X3 n=1 Tax=Etheostoma cragini TaxID=417921 RepID=UPI00155DF62F|nr:protein FAM169B isoform X3 [Etheostoma cragini]
MYPVDLPDVDDTGLTSASQKYLSSLESGPCNEEWFQLSQTLKVAITADSVRRVHLFENNQPDCALLALYSPDDPTQVVALYLHEKWWCVEDVLRTSSKSRSGLIMVQSITERVIVFLLSQVVERSSQEKALFSLHPPTESCKLLWRDSQAVGFYTVKHKVCRSFLQQHEEHLEQLYEVEAPGDWSQRRNIWLSIQLGRYSLGDSEENSPTSGEMQKNEGEHSSQKTYSRTVDPTSASTCNVSIPLVIHSPASQTKPCDLRRGRSFPQQRDLWNRMSCSPR